MPSPRLALALLLITAYSVYACSGGSRVDAAAAAGPPFDSLRLMQGPCFGTCPVYSLTVFPDGRAVFEGKQYARYRGRHLARVGGDTLERLRIRARRVLAQADTLPRHVESGITDLSQRTVEVYRDEDAYSFTGNVDFAEPVEELLESLQSVASRSDWARAPGTPPPPPSELVVVLAGTEVLDELRGEFYRQQLRPLDTLALDPPTYRLHFDPYTMTTDEMLRDLGARDDVVEVRVAGAN